MRRTLIATSLAAAAAAASAGTAEVRFVEPQNFRDAGFGVREIDRNTGELAAEIERLARRLPEGQTLKVDITDVDLAGHVERRGLRDIRILRGGADWPRIELRWQLVADGRVLRSGEERLADMNYLMNASAFAPYAAQAHEARLLGRWFGDTFGTPR